MNSSEVLESHELNIEDATEHVSGKFHFQRKKTHDDLSVVGKKGGGGGELGGTGTDKAFDHVISSRRIILSVSLCLSVSLSLSLSLSLSVSLRSLFFFYNSVATA